MKEYKKYCKNCLKPLKKSPFSKFLTKYHNILLPNHNNHPNSFLSLCSKILAKILFFFMLFFPISSLALFPKPILPPEFLQKGLFQTLKFLDKHECEYS
jgi:hypothetical protein